MMTRIFMIAAFTLFIGACSSPKDANEKNFSTAVRDYLKHRETKGDYCIGKGPYPYKAAIALDSVPILEDMGLVKKVGEATTGFWSQTIYDLTEKGKNLFHAGKGFCYGKPVLVRINNFSEPQGMFGQTISTVNYEYKLVDVPEWAIELSKTIKEGSLLSEIRDKVNSSTNPIKEQDVLILTNNGWIHKELFRQ